MEVHVDRSWVGRTIDQIEAATGARVPFVFRLGAGMVPKRGTVFQDGDLIYAAVADEPARRGRGHPRRRARRRV